MTDNINSPSSSPEIESEIPPNAGDIIRDMQYILHVFDLLYCRHEELTFCLAELKKRNLTYEIKVKAVEDSINGLFRSIMEEILFSNQTLLELMSQSSNSK